MQAFVHCVQCEWAITFTHKDGRTLPLSWRRYAPSTPAASAGYHWQLLGALSSTSAERSLLWFQVVICSILQNLDANGNVSTLLERASIRGPASKWAIKHRDWSVAVSEKNGWLLLKLMHQNHFLKFSWVDRMLRLMLGKLITGSLLDGKSNDSNPDQSVAHVPSHMGLWFLNLVYACRHKHC